MSVTKADEAGCFYLIKNLRAYKKSKAEGKAVKSRRCPATVFGTKPTGDKSGEVKG